MTRDRPGSGESALGGNQNVKMGCYFSRYRTRGGALRIHRNRFCRGRNRQIPLLSVPRHMPDLFNHWHIDREEGHVTTSRLGSFSNVSFNGWKLFLLPRLPRLHHVFLAQLTFVANQRELQRVIRSIEFVNPGTIATSWINSTSALKRRLITLHGVRSPRVTFAVVLQINVKCAVCLNRPNRAERVRPSSDQGGFPGLSKHGASAKQREGGCGHNDTERDLVLHVAMLFGPHDLFKQRRTTRLY